MDYLPKIKMDFVPNEEENENIEENVIVKESEELECDILGKEELIPEPTKKNESMNTNEIFESISEPKSIEILKTNLEKINNDIECIKKDLQAIYALIDLKEKRKNLEKESMWFFT